MTDSNPDQGVIAALLERFQEFRLPRLLRLKEKVDQGAKLGDEDLDFLKRVFADAEEVKHLVAKHPELQELAGRAVRLYQEITAQALKNEQA